MPSPKADNIPMETIDPFSDTRPVVSPNPEFVRKNALREKRKKEKKVDDYFVGPRDMTHHSKWPYFFRLHGSVIPIMIIPMTLVALWSIFVYYLCELYLAKQNHNFDPILLTVLGFLVGLALSFRSTTAYERYNEGRKYWAQLTLTTQNLARVIWVHAREREGEEGKEDLLAKITCLNLIVAFSYALKHRLRFEPYVDYADMRGYVEYLDTFAKEANQGVDSTPPKQSGWKQFGEFVGISFAEDNPRKPLKEATKPLGNLPLEILVHLQGYLDGIIDNGTLKAPIYQVQSLTAVATMNDILTGCDRILNTPIPLAYSIAISQITWTYILILPFQLWKRLKVITVPATLLAAYIILGLSMIGSEIENPFGLGVNDLPLDDFCKQIASDLDIIASSPAPKSKDFVKRALNLPLFPLSWGGYPSWAARSTEEIRDALRVKINVHGEDRKDFDRYEADSSSDDRGARV